MVLLIISAALHYDDVVVITDISILNSLEWTKRLDKIWKKNKEQDEGLTWQYIGTQTGVMRIFPGQF